MVNNEFQNKINKKCSSNKICLQGTYPALTTL